MATKKATKKADVKFPGTMFVVRDVWCDVEIYNALKDINECASDTTVRVGVYQLVGYKDVTKVTEIKVEDVNG